MNNSKALRHSFEERLKRRGIPLPKDLAVEGIPDIVQDQHGRYWKYNENHTVKWRVDERGNDLTLKNRFDSLRAEDAKWKNLIDNEKDASVKELLEEERLYDSVGGSASQWSELDEKKRDLRAKGKVMPQTPVDIRRNLAELTTVIEEEEEEEEEEEGGEREEEEENAEEEGT